MSDMILVSILIVIVVLLLAAPVVLLVKALKAQKIQDSDIPSDVFESDQPKQTFLEQLSTRAEIQKDLDFFESQTVKPTLLSSEGRDSEDNDNTPFNEEFLP